MNLNRLIGSDLLIYQFVSFFNDKIVPDLESYDFSSGDINTDYLSYDSVLDTLPSEIQYFYDFITKNSIVPDYFEIYEKIHTPVVVDSDFDREYVILITGGYQSVWELAIAEESPGKFLPYIVEEFRPTWIASEHDISHLLVSWLLHTITISGSVLSNEVADERNRQTYLSSTEALDTVNKSKHPPHLLMDSAYFGIGPHFWYHEPSMLIWCGDRSHISAGRFLKSKITG